VREDLGHPVGIEPLVVLGNQLSPAYQQLAGGRLRELDPRAQLAQPGVVDALL
jgi:hypothetical protein